MSRIDEALRRANQQRRAGAVAYEEDLAALHGRDPMSPLMHYVSEGLPERHPGQIGTAVMPFPPAIEERVERAARPATVRSEPVTMAPAAFDDTLIVSQAANPIGVEQYRRVAAELHHLHGSRGTKTVMITSATAGEGKTLTSANIALTLSESFRRRVLLIDADLRRPTVHQLFNVPSAPGLAESLNSDVDPMLPVIELSERLSILPAGQPELHPLAGLSSSRLSRLLAEASSRFDWVIIDTPPIALLPDANLLADLVDAVIFVIAAGRTKFPLVQKAINAINGDRLVGVVLNGAEPGVTGSDYYRYYQANTAGDSRGSRGR